MSFSRLNFPEDLKGLSLQDLESLADDLRQAILSVCLKNGGHLGASLGTVELAIALHRMFQSPKEPIVWDVGHQAYAHKLLTGRWERFHTLRQIEGISGFLSRQENEHDTFGAGHSSTALSAALAMAWHRSGTQDWTVAVVGDGGLTAGVAFEALNNVRGTRMGPLLLVLNDNQMSISPNVGAVSNLFSGGSARSFFELFGFEYVGPTNGHDLSSLLGQLKAIREQGSGKPILLHVMTQKGKGYAPAEEHPAAFHGVSPVQEKLPEKASSSGTSLTKKKSYSEAFGDALCELAKKDPKIVAITAAMTEGTGLVRFASEFPDRFFDVGIAEPHAVTFAAGLATQGYRPVVAIYSTFLQRALDGLIHDVAIQNLGVTFALDRAGLVGADGPTHHGAFDIAYTGMIPGFQLRAPACLSDMRLLLEQAVRAGTPVAIRYPRGSGPEELHGTDAGEGVRVHTNAGSPELILIAAGASAQRAIAAARRVDPAGGRIRVLSVTQLKPIPASLLKRIVGTRAPLMIVEDGAIRGGFGEALLGELRGWARQIELAGYGDHFIQHGSVAELEEREGLSESKLADRISRILS